MTFGIPSLETKPTGAYNVTDIKPLGRVTKRRHCITIEIKPDVPPAWWQRDPRLNKNFADRSEKTEEKLANAPYPKKRKSSSSVSSTEKRSKLGRKVPCQEDIGRDFLALTSEWEHFFSKTTSIPGLELATHAETTYPVVDLNEDESDNEVLVVESEDKDSDQIDVSSTSKLEDSQEIEEEEDDVIHIPELMEQLLVEDDDTDDKSSAKLAARDQDVLNFANIKIKQEPIDPDDEPIITAEEDPIVPVVELSATNNTVTLTMDGNVEPSAPPASLFAPIKINITNFPTVAPTPPTLVHQDTEEDPLIPEEEPEFTVKDTMRDMHFSCQPPVQSGDELSAMCSIM